MVITIRDGKNLYGALRYNSDKEGLEKGKVILTNEVSQGPGQNRMQS